MMKLVLAGVVAFVVGVAGGAGVVVMRSPAPVVAKPDAERPTPVAAPKAAPAVAPEPREDVASHAPAIPPTATVVAAAAPTGRPVVEQARTAAGTAADSAESYGQVARILTSMKPAEAVKIMAYLSDDQVEGILRSLGVRPAAILLAQFPVERAARLSRRLMAVHGAEVTR